MPDMLMIGFPSARRGSASRAKLTLYTIISNRVRTVYKVTLPVAVGDPEAAAALTCSCPVFRHESKCDHIDLCEKVLDSSGVTTSGVRYRLEDFDDYVFVYRPAEGDLWVVDPKTTGELPLSKFVEGCNATGFRAGDGFDVNTLRTQCSIAEKLAIAINDPGVESEAASVSAPVEADPEVEEDGDELLEIASPAVVPEMSWVRKRPLSSVFYVDPDVWKSVLFTIHSGGNVLLLGPSGSGKTELAYLAAKAFGVPLEVFNCGAMSEPRSTLIGNTHYDKDRGTWFQESRFVRAMRDTEDAGGVVLLDELTRAVRSAFNILLPLLDQQRYLALDESESGEVIRRGDRVAVIATANIGVEYSGTEAMDRALRERFSFIIEMQFPFREVEKKILLKRCPGLSAMDATRLVVAAEKQRAMAQVGDFGECISTRMLLAAGFAITSGFSFSVAVRFAIEGGFSGEGGANSERAGIRQIFQKGA